MPRPAPLTRLQPHERLRRTSKAYAALTPTPSPMEMVRTSQKPARVVGAARAAMAAGSHASTDNIVDAALAWLGERPSAFVSDGPDAMPKLRLSAAPLLRGSRRAHGQRLVAHRPGMRRGRLRWGMVMAQRAP